MMDDNQYTDQSQENNSAPLDHEPQHADASEQQYAQPQQPQYGQPQQPQYGQPQPPQYGQPQPPQYGQPQQPQYAQPQPPQYGQPQPPQYGQPQPPQYGQPQPPQYGQPQPPQYGQPPQQPQQYAPPEKDKADGKCIASMVLGICSIVFCWVPILGLVAAIIGLVLGISARKNNKSGIGLAGIITSSLGLAACVIYTIVWIFLISAATTYYYNDFWNWGTYY